MTPEERSLLERTHHLVQENNEILHKMRRSHRLGLVLRIFYWVIIIGISFGAFYLIQPYIDAITGKGDSTEGQSKSKFEMLKDLYTF